MSTELNRREFLTLTLGALGGAAVGGWTLEGLTNQAESYEAKLSRELYTPREWSNEEKLKISRYFEPKDFQGPFVIDENKIVDAQDSQVERYLGVNMFDLLGAFGIQYRWDLPPTSQDELKQKMKLLKDSGVNYVRFLAPPNIGEERIKEILPQALEMIKSTGMKASIVLESWWRHDYDPGQEHLTSTDLENADFVAKATRHAKVVCDIVRDYGFEDVIAEIEPINEPSPIDTLSWVEGVLTDKKQRSVITYVETINEVIRNRMEKNIVAGPGLIWGFWAGLKNNLSLWQRLLETSPLSISFYPDFKRESIFFASKFVGEFLNNIYPQIKNTAPVVIEEFSPLPEKIPGGPGNIDNYARVLGNFLIYLDQFNPTKVGLWGVKLGQNPWEPIDATFVFSQNAETVALALGRLKEMSIN